MVVTKAELVSRLINETNLVKPDAIKLVELFFQEISDALGKGEEVKLSNFGHFILHQKKERPGRNPRTGTAVSVKARRVVTFHVSQKLRKRIEKLKVKKKRSRVLTPSLT